MEKVKYIYDMDLINERDSSYDEFDMSSSINTKIILELLSKPCSERILSYNTGVSMHLIQLSLNRLMKKNIVKIRESNIVDGKLENKYELSSNDIELLSKITLDQCKDPEIAVKVAAHNFSNITKDIIEKIGKEKEKTNSTKAVFIKVSSKKMPKFKEALDKLVAEFEELEDIEEKEVYAFVHALGPYGE